MMKQWDFIIIVLSVCLFSSSVLASAPFTMPKPKLKVAVLIFDGVELLDFAGPAEVFIVAGNSKLFTLFTVAATKESITTMGGINVEPKFSITNAPKADILVVPGGNISSVSKPVLEWIKKSAPDCKVVMSVCMGAFLLADIGLLDGIEATTHQWGIKGLQRAAPKCTVRADKRFIDSGKILTTGGVAAGIDGALHLVERFYGKKAAKWTADEWMEYKRPEVIVPK